MANVNILLIEDEPSICDNILFAAKKEGFAVVVANTGNDGLWLLKSHDFSLVILDVGLPDISGFEVCKEIRKISGLTQQELADKVGLKHNYISHVEKGNTDIQLSSFFKIISALGLKINLEIA